MFIKQPSTWEVNQRHDWTSQQEEMHDSWSWNAPLQDNVEVSTDKTELKEASWRVRAMKLRRYNSVSEKKHANPYQDDSLDP